MLHTLLNNLFEIFIFQKISKISIGLWVRIHMVIVDWFGLGHSASGLGWIGFSKMDPCPTLRWHIQQCRGDNKTDTTERRQHKSVKDRVSPECWRHKRYTG